MKYCKKKIVWNVHENNLLKVNLKIFCYIHLFVVYILIEWTSRVSCEKYSEKCYDQLYLCILPSCNYYKALNFEGMKNCNKIKTV